MINEAMFTSNTAEWATPQAFFDELNAEFHFTLDPCATPQNAKCPKYYTKEQDGLSQSWDGERVFCNPPYGREIGKWIEKASREVCGGGYTVVVMLVPARTDTKYFHEFIYGKAEIRFIRGRLHFNDSKMGAPFPSMIVIFRGGKGKVNTKQNCNCCVKESVCKYKVEYENDCAAITGGIVGATTEVRIVCKEFATKDSILKSREAKE